MKLEHEFRVPVPVAQAWDVLLDVERIAPCMPGATVESFDGETVDGRVKVKVGPIQVTYSGTARFIEKDEAARRAVIEASGKEARGIGHGHGDDHRRAARTTAASTEVTVTTDLAITGKPAQFGRGVMVEVGNKLLGRFADCLADDAGRRRGHRLVDRGRGRAGAGSDPAATAPAAADAAAAAAVAAATVGHADARLPAPSPAPTAAAADRSRTTPSTCSTRRGCRCSSGPPRSSSAWWSFFLSLAARGPAALTARRTAVPYGGRRALGERPWRVRPRPARVEPCSCSSSVGRRSSAAPRWSRRWPAAGRSPRSTAAVSGPDVEGVEPLRGDRADRRALGQLDGPARSTSSSTPAASCPAWSASRLRALAESRCALRLRLQHLGHDDLAGPADARGPRRAALRARRRPGRRGLRRAQGRLRARGAPRSSATARRSRGPG